MRKKLLTEADPIMTQTMDLAGNLCVYVFICRENSFQNRLKRIPQILKLENLKNNQKEVIDLNKMHI